MQRFYSTALSVLVLLALASAASAAPSFYAVGKFGGAMQDFTTGETHSQDIYGDDEGWGLGIGLRLGKYLAFQAEYQDLGSALGAGSPCSDINELCLALRIPVDSDAKAISASVLPHLPLNRRFSLYGKLGIAFWESEVFDILDTSHRLIDEFDGEDLLYGAGLRVRLSSRFDVFTEYETIADRSESVFLGTTFSF